jgi:uncharacterized protein YqeY
MTLEILNKAKTDAWKAGEVFRKNAISGMIDAVQKASITNKGRIDITEQLVNETLIKYQKTVQEQYDTCPETAEYADRKRDYLEELTIVKEFAPQLITDAAEITKIILNMAELDNKMALVKTNRGYIMKTLSASLRGKADMAIVNKVVGDLLV